MNIRKALVVRAIANYMITGVILDTEFVALLCFSNHINVLSEARTTTVYSCMQTCMTVYYHLHCFTCSYHVY